MPPAATMPSCSATAMAGSWRCKWPFAIPNIATKLILADCGAAFSEPGREAFRNMAAASKAKGLSAITDVAMRRLFAPEFQAQHPDLMRDRREAFLRTDPEVFRAACEALAELDLRPELAGSRSPSWCWSANMTRRRRRRCRTNWPPACRTRVSRSFRAARMSRSCNRPRFFWMRSAISCRHRKVRVRRTGRFVTLLMPTI